MQLKNCNMCRLIWIILTHFSLLVLIHDTQFKCQKPYDQLLIHSEDGTMGWIKFEEIRHIALQKHFERSTNKHELWGLTFHKSKLQIVSWPEGRILLPRQIILNQARYSSLAWKDAEGIRTETMHIVQGRINIIWTSSGRFVPCLTYYQ